MAKTAKDIIKQINASNASSIQQRAQDLYNSKKINETDYMSIRNAARNFGFNETQAATGSVVASTGGTIPPKGEGSYVTGTEPINTGPKTDVNNINTSTDATNTVTNTIKDNISTTNQQAEDYTNAMNTRTEEDKKKAEEERIRAEEYAKKQQELLIETDNKVKNLEGEIQKLIEERKGRDVTDLETKKQSEIDALKAQGELEKYKNEQSIKEAQRKIEVSNMKAAWAFNKMGLGFSSAAIATTSKIAIDGADKIAGLKLQAAANESGFAKDIAQIEFNYTREINSTIDKYTDAGIQLKEGAIKRVYELQNNLLLSEKEKNDEIKKITDEYLKSKRDNEDKIYAEMERLRDKQFEQIQALEQQLIQTENTAKTKVNDLITSGVWNTLSSIKKEEYLKKANITEAEANQAIKSTIYNQAYNAMQSILGQDYLPSVAEMDKIQSEVDRLMLAGRPMDEAINIATNRVIKANPRYNTIISSGAKSSGGTGSLTAKSNLTTAADILGFAKANKLNISATDAKSLANLDEETLAVYLDNMLANQQSYEDKQTAKEQADLKEKTKPKLTTIGKGLLEDYAKNKDSTTKAQATYNELINSNYSPKGALDLMASQDSDLKVEEMTDGSYRLIDKDVFGDDTVLEGIK